MRGRGSAKTQISAWSIAAAAPAVVVVLEADGTLDIDGARSRTPVQEEARATCRSWTLSTVTTAGDGFSWVNILEIGVNVGSLKDAQHELSEKIKQRAAGFKAP
ncbi:MAG: hypothetical protein H6709_16055 [Kofleriaceae bacterium]|nr:hypothetical protein [Myxococcales bacterium]MCB9563225.1 hypothetical protein [Kofleriaceae bacterium]MCB9573593.1 hypothetical protein [Kofleriaceae bacterium]